MGNRGPREAILLAQPDDLQSVENPPWSPHTLPVGSGVAQASRNTLADQFTFELGDACENLKQQAAGGV